METLTLTAELSIKAHAEKINDYIDLIEYGERKIRHIETSQYYVVFGNSKMQESRVKQLRGAIARVKGRVNFLIDEMQTLKY